MPTPTSTDISNIDFESLVRRSDVAFLGFVRKGPMRDSIRDNYIKCWNLIDVVNFYNRLNVTTVHNNSQKSVFEYSSSLSLADIEYNSLVRSSDYMIGGTGNMLSNHRRSESPARGIDSSTIGIFKGINHAGYDHKWFFRTPSELERYKLLIGITPDSVRGIHVNYKAPIHGGNGIRVIVKSQVGSAGVTSYEYYSLIKTILTNYYMYDSDVIDIALLESIPYHDSASKNFLSLHALILFASGFMHTSTPGGEIKLESLPQMISDYVNQFMTINVSNQEPLRITILCDLDTHSNIRYTNICLSDGHSSYPLFFSYDNDGTRPITLTGVIASTYYHLRNFELSVKSTSLNFYQRVLDLYHNSVISNYNKKMINFTGKGDHTSYEWEMFSGYHSALKLQENIKVMSFDDKPNIPNIPKKSMLLDRKNYICREVNYSIAETSYHLYRNHYDAQSGWNSLRNRNTLFLRDWDAVSIRERTAQLLGFTGDDGEGFNTDIQMILAENFMRLEITNKIIGIFSDGFSFYRITIPEEPQSSKVAPSKPKRITKPTSTEKPPTLIKIMGLDAALDEDNNATVSIPISDPPSFTYIVDDEDGDDGYDDDDDDDDETLF